MPSPSAKSRSAAGGAARHLSVVPPVAAPVAAAAVAGAAITAAKPKAAAAARSLGDWVWHGLGAGVAAGSAGFATYALLFSTGEVVPSGNFNLFARYDRLYQAAGARHAAAVATEGAQTAAADPVDFTPTGSLAGTGGANARRGADGPPLPGFTLRDVFDGKALVESRSSLSVVKPGSVIAGAGEVLSIEKRGERWVVLTANGVIAGGGR